jgi:tetratricopeptide (TPR) repeat protein
METKTVTHTAARARVLNTVTERCSEAKSLMSSGDYEAAREALGPLWRGVGERPNLDGLSAEDQAELLLRSGALSAWAGSSSQISGAQAFAKDLISESIRAFEELGDREKIAEAQSDLALCYWREGAMDEARVWFREAVSKAGDPLNRLRILVRSTTVEFSTNRCVDALNLLDEAAPLLDQVDDPATLGCYHMQRAAILEKLGGTENIDRAIIENTAASLSFEKANHRRYFARVENNMGHIFLKLRRYDEALAHFDRARETLTDLGDVGTAAQVNENRARAFVATGRYVEAEKIAFLAASTFEGGDEQSLLAEALETQGIALARMGRFQSALNTLKRAAYIAETAGDVAFAGRIFLTILEEVKSFLSPEEIRTLYHDADERLGDEVLAETVNRLRACARLAISNAPAPASHSKEASRSFEEQVHRCESDLIKAALDDARGSVTRAAKALGLTHQGLCYIINHRHKELLTARAPIRVRRKSIIKKRS